MNPLTESAQKIGEEFSTPTLSTVDVMLQMNATPSISFGPGSASRARNGAR